MIKQKNKRKVEEKNSKRYKTNKFFKKKTFVIFFAVLLLFLATYILVDTFSLFETNTLSKADLDLAFYCIKDEYQNMNLKLENLEPRDNPYIYNFGIYNFKSGKRTETNLEYTLKIRATTNLPLSYRLLYAGRNIQPKKDEEYIELNTRRNI